MSDFGDDLGESLTRIATTQGGYVLREALRAAYRHLSGKDASEGGGANTHRPARIAQDNIENIDQIEATEQIGRDAEFRFKVNDADPRGEIMTGPLQRGGVKFRTELNDGVLSIFTHASSTPELLNLADHYMATGRLSKDRFPNYDDYARDFGEMKANGHWRWNGRAGHAEGAREESYGRLIVDDDEAQMAVCDVFSKEGISNSAYIDAHGEHVVVFSERELLGRFPSEEAFDAWLEAGGDERLKGVALSSERTREIRADAMDRAKTDCASRADRQATPGADLNPSAEAQRLEAQAQKMGIAKAAPKKTPSMGAR